MDKISDTKTSLKKLRKFIIFAVVGFVFFVIVNFFVSFLPLSNVIYDKYVNFVSFSKMPQLCNLYPFGRFFGDYSTPATESRYFCKADFAIKVVDIDYCNALDSQAKIKGTASQRNYCLRGLAKKLHAPNLCKDLKLYGWEEKYEQDLIKTCQIEAQ